VARAKDRASVATCQLRRDGKRRTESPVRTPHAPAIVTRAIAPPGAAGCNAADMASLVTLAQAQQWDKCHAMLDQGKGDVHERTPPVSFPPTVCRSLSISLARWVGASASPATRILKLHRPGGPGREPTHPTPQSMRSPHRSRTCPFTRTSSPAPFRLGRLACCSLHPVAACRAHRCFTPQ